jgi:hypothetical protein
MNDSWILDVARDDLSDAVLSPSPRPVLQSGQALLKIERVGLTANNVTYAVLGESFRYWEFFPTSAGRGVVPLWGFASVAASTVAGVEVGARFYGYLPSAGHLVVEPVRIDERGFRDGSAHRADLPSPYNAYAITTADAAYSRDDEDLQVLYRPLFYTSFLLADQITDKDFYGAHTVVLSSASSKTAYGAAFLLKGLGATVVGLTSPSNLAFTASLGSYDRVLAYPDLVSVPAGVTAYVDLAGSSELRGAVHAHFGAALTTDLVVGITHQDQTRAGTLAGARPTTFFAPDQMAKRVRDWGRAGLDARFAEAWHRFLPAVRQWVDVTVEHGPDALRRTWLDVLAGQMPPRIGPVITF